MRLSPGLSVGGDRVVIPCCRVRGYGVPPRRGSRWETEILARRSKRAAPTIRRARASRVLVAGPDRVPGRASISVRRATSVAVTRRENACRGAPCRDDRVPSWPYEPGHRRA